MRQQVRMALPLSLLLCCFAGHAAAAPVTVANPSFETGGTSPSGWTLSGGTGTWLSGNAADGNRCVAVIGSTDSSNYWRSDNFPVISSMAYRVSFYARGTKGVNAGGLVTGPSFSNRDITSPSGDWQEYSTVFMAPSNIAVGYLRFGHWHYPGTASFDKISLDQVEPAYQTTGDIALGEGESIAGNTYTFSCPLAGGSFSRPLVGYAATHNTNRWSFGAGSRVLYRHIIGTRAQTSATLTLNVLYYTSGALAVEASADGSSFTSLGSLTAAGSTAFPLPGSLLPATTIWVRLSGQGSPVSLQVDRYDYSAVIDGAPLTAAGSTQFYSYTGQDPRLAVNVESFGEETPGGDNRVVVHITNNSSETIAASPQLSLQLSGGSTVSFSSASAAVLLQPGETVVTIPYEVYAAGNYNAVFSLGNGIAGEVATRFSVSEALEGDFGELLSSSNTAAALWWAPSGWKVLQKHPLPLKTATAISISAARNEAEAAQLVIYPRQALTNFQATGGDLSGPNGAVLPAGAVEVLRERYVTVKYPTDSYGIEGGWPDPLPPFKGGIALAAGQNQPLWIRVTVATGTPAGLYRGAVHLTADGYEAEVPLEVTVYDFTLPDEMSCTGALALYPQFVWQYHKVTNPQQQRQVLEKYWKTFAAHHISPFNPAPLDRFGYSLPASTIPWSGYVGVSSETAHAGDCSLKVNDSDSDSAVNGLYKNWIPLPANGVTFSFWYKTRTAGQQFTVKLLYQNASAGSDTAVELTGDGAWQQYSQLYNSFPAGATALRPQFYGARSDANGNRGLVWYDDVAIRNESTGGECLLNGGFEVLDATSSLPVTFSWTAWDAEVTRVFNQYHFNSALISLPGLGGGGNGNEYEPTFVGYTECMPQYKTVFEQWYRGFEQHLREKGWLEKMHGYWYDEPGPDDYAYVRNGFVKVRNIAPELSLFLSEQIEPGLIGGPNLWCPVSYEYDEGPCRERQQAGEKLWWYLCMTPLAPYCGLFIDHPGVDLRTWLWQTWQRGITGFNVWCVNYWNNAVLNPDPAAPQDPYEDPMSYNDTAFHFGNGDGRFLYPPEGATGKQASPVLDGPVDSIRWEILRDGIEDYEYFVLLREALKKQGAAFPLEEQARFNSLLMVPEDVTSDMVTYSRDPALLGAHRDAIARAIETIARGPVTPAVNGGPLRVDVYPRTVTANGDGKNDRLFFKCSHAGAAQLRYKIYDMGGIMVADGTITGNQTGRLLADGAWLSYWDARDLSNNYVRPGPYLLIIMKDGDLYKREFIAVSR